MEAAHHEINGTNTKSIIKKMNWTSWLYLQSGHPNNRFCFTKFSQLVPTLIFTMTDKENNKFLRKHRLTDSWSIKLALVARKFPLAATPFGFKHKPHHRHKNRTQEERATTLQLLGGQPKSWPCSGRRAGMCRPDTRTNIML